MSSTERDARADWEDRIGRHTDVATYRPPALEAPTGVRVYTSRGQVTEELEPVDGSDMERLAKDVMSQPPAILERMVAEVCLGRVGAVAAREVSRFARNSREWQQLVEVCRVVDTLLIDQETVYAPRQSNDRLLLGLKGSLNEYELDLLRQRSLEARREMAKRGELIVAAPVPASVAAPTLSQNRLGISSPSCTPRCSPGTSGRSPPRPVPG
jgi:hypothetical protein